MIDFLRTRRSVRKFSEKTIEPEKLELLKEAILRSPTSKNSNAGEFILVDNPNIIEKLAQCKPSGAGALRTAQLAVVVLTCERQTGAWIEDSAVASIILQLTAQSLDLGSCWIQIRGRDYNEEKTSEAYVCETLNIPEGFRVLSVVAIGYPLHQTEGKKFSNLDFGKIRMNGF